MTFNETMKLLKSLGTEQNVKVYKRHGAGDNLFGVSFANLGKLQKQIKTDHDLALKLWASGNSDAMTLALMIADPQAMTPKLLDEWVKTTNYYVIGDIFSGLAVKTPHALTKMKEWTKSKDEYVGQAGWNLLAHLAMKDESLTDEFFNPYLETIRKSIHKNKNRTRHAMNGALIAVGIRNSALQKKALTIAKEIGKVEVDHGETSCKTPDAASYIQKVLARKSAKKPARATA